MRVTRWTLVALALAARAAPAGAQDARPRRAFEPAVTVTGAVTLFGERLTALNSNFGYKNSIGVGLWGELPITRRIGLLGLATISPISAQREEGANANTAIYRDVISVAADAGLGARLKPAVPVFFFVGGGVHTATHYPNPEADGVAVEPQGTFAIGYDALSRGRWNVRTAVVAHLVKPADPGGVDLKSAALDWAFHVGGRFALSSITAPAGGAP
jgi:hypothetical protein